MNVVAQTSFGPGSHHLSLPCGDKSGQNLPVKYWETIADNLSKAGWSWGWVSAVESDRANARATTSAGLPVLY